MFESAQLTKAHYLGALLTIVCIAGILLVYRGQQIFLGQLRVFSTQQAVQRLTTPVGMTDVGWRLEDGSMQKAWYLPSANGAVILYLHGSPGNRSSLLDEASHLAKLGYGALLLDLPGHGDSEGAPNWDDHFQESVAKALDYVAAQPETDPGRIGALAYSMGTLTISKVAEKDGRLAAIVLLAPFTNLKDQLKYQFRSRFSDGFWYAYAGALLGGVPFEKMDTLKALSNGKPLPLLIIAGDEDSAIPLEMPYRLQKAKAGARIWVAKGVGHTQFSILAGDGYFEELRNFFGTTIAKKQL
jgi:pimeloyl-ACP methyl ester carboxylesterase